MSQSKILIIGAGAAGLMAGRELSKAGNKVLILEASERCGGRVFDAHDPAFPASVMLGAEFIHGKLPFTISLIKEAGIHFYPVEGKSVRMLQGKTTEGREGNEYWSLLIDKLGALGEDMSLSAFLDEHFREDQYNAFRESVLRFAQGFDAADPGRVSAKALLKEWEQEEDEQYRVEGGYGSLISFLESECACYGCDIRLNSIVSAISWRRGYVEARTVSGERFIAGKAVIAVPVGVLQLKEGEPGSLIFDPPIPGIKHRIHLIGFGAVIKAVLHFRDAFWERYAGNDTGFIFSEEVFPTWWTQLPRRIPVLTGWMGGPDASFYCNATDSQLLEMALRSLSIIFGVNTDFLRTELLAWKICNWAAVPFSRGAYTYPTVDVPETAGVFVPVDDTLYFAGEAAYNGPHGGTVEAALVSAKGVLDHIDAESHSLTYHT